MRFGVRAKPVASVRRSRPGIDETNDIVGVLNLRLDKGDHSAFRRLAGLQLRLPSLRTSSTLR
jgi:hypothetical protein